MRANVAPDSSPHQHSRDHSMIDCLHRSAREGISGGDATLAAANRSCHLTAVLPPDHVARRVDVWDVCSQGCVDDGFAAFVHLHTSPVHGMLSVLGRLPVATSTRSVRYCRSCPATTAVVTISAPSCLHRLRVHEPHVASLYTDVAADQPDLDGSTPYFATSVL